MFKDFLKENSGFSMMRIQSLFTVLMGALIVVTGVIHSLFITFSGGDINVTFVTICFSGSGLLSGIGIAGKVLQKKHEKKKED